MIVFAHLSDTHFGDVLANSQPGVTKHQDPHSVVMCLALYSALLNAQAASKLPQGSPLPIVHSGDLTLSGEGAEFAVGQAFLRSRIRIRRNRLGGFMGLTVSDDQLALVPGNHDHWIGRKGATNYAKGVPAFNPALRGRQFRPTPWSKRWQDIGVQGPGMEVFGVDSASGFDSTSKSWLARGRISAHEFADLEKLLQRSRNRGVGVVRAVICHHSLAYRAGNWGPGSWQTGELEADSRDELLRLSAEYHVSAILTGHTHDFYHHEFSLLDSSGQPFSVHELRCASTLALAQEHNGFWLHKIAVGAGGRRTWHAWRYEWNQTQFVTQAAPAVSFPIA